MSGLPTTEFNGKMWYVDDRLHQFRQVEDPHVWVDFQTFDEGVFNEATGVWLKPDELNDREFKVFAFDKAWMVEAGIAGAERLGEQDMNEVVSRLKEALHDLGFVTEVLRETVEHHLHRKDWQVRQAERGCGCQDDWPGVCRLLQKGQMIKAALVAMGDVELREALTCECLCHVEGLAPHTCGFCGHAHYAADEDCTFVDPDGVACTCTAGQPRPDGPGSGYVLLPTGATNVPICGECGRSVRMGSGWFVNRVPDGNDVKTRVEMGRTFPAGGFICCSCEEEWDDEAWEDRKSEAGCQCTTREPDDCKFDVPDGQKMCWCKCHVDPAVAEADAVWASRPIPGSEGGAA